MSTENSNFAMTMVETMEINQTVLQSLKILDYVAFQDFATYEAGKWIFPRCQRCKFPKILHREEEITDCKKEPLKEQNIKKKNQRLVNSILKNEAFKKATEDVQVIFDTNCGRCYWWGTTRKALKNHQAKCRGEREHVRSNFSCSKCGKRKFHICDDFKLRFGPYRPLESFGSASNFAAKNGCQEDFAPPLFNDSDSSLPTFPGLEDTDHTEGGHEDLVEEIEMVTTFLGNKTEKTVDGKDIACKAVEDCVLCVEPPADSVANSLAHEVEPTFLVPPAPSDNRINNFQRNFRSSFRGEIDFLVNDSSPFVRYSWPPSPCKSLGSSQPLLHIVDVAASGSQHTTAV